MVISIWQLGKIHGATQYDKKLLRRELCFRICIPDSLSRLAVNSNFYRINFIYLSGLHSIRDLRCC